MADPENQPTPSTKAAPGWSITPVEVERVAVGGKLREARESRGLSRADVAAVLKIRQTHIAAIEEGRVEDLPGLPYAVGFVRTYAEYLDMDGLDAVRRFKDEVAEPEEDKELVFPTPIRQRRFPLAFVLAAVAVVGAAVYAGWLFLAPPETPVAEAPPDAPAVAASAAAEATPTEDASAEPVAGAEPPTNDIAPPTRETSTEDVAAPKAEPAAESPPPETATTEPASETGTSAPAASGAASAEGPSRRSGDEADGAPAEPVADAAEPSEAAPAEPSPDPTPVAEAETRVAEAPATPEPEAIARPSITEAPADAEPASAEAASAETAETTPEPPSPPVDAPTTAETPRPDSTEEAAISPLAGPSVGAPRIELRAAADSWVQIRDASNRIVFSRVLREGERFGIPPDPGLIMVTGNAGALEVFVDGRRIDSLGPMGAVRRDIALDPDRLLAR